MKKWTQQELDALERGIDGIIRTGTGDFSDCNFFGRNRVIIGPDSILGPGTQLGASCKLGEGCIVGGGFSSRDFLSVGEHCYFGEDAHIGFGSRISANCQFASGCVIEPETIIAEDVEIRGLCTIYGVKNADGNSLLHIGRVAGRKVYAFMATDEDGGRCCYVGCTGVAPMPAAGFIGYAQGRGTAANRHYEDWQKIQAAAEYASKMLEGG